MADSFMDEVAKEVAGLAKEVYGDLAKDSVKVFGQVFSSFLDYITGAPRYWLMFQNEKRRLKFGQAIKKITRDLEGVPAENLLPIPAELAVPVLEELTLTTNEEIADMFTALLTKAANTETVNLAHPSFRHIIARLSSDEAYLLKYFNGFGRKAITAIPILMTNKQRPIHKSGFIFFDYEVNDLISFPLNLEAYMSNLLSLGIIRTDYSPFDKPVYSEEQAISYFDSKIYKKKEDEGVGAGASCYWLTDLGLLFLKAISKTPENRNDTGGLTAP